jgi:hypothetical protein
LFEKNKADHSCFYAGDGSGWSVLSPVKSFWNEVLVPFVRRLDLNIAKVCFYILERAEYVPTFSAQGLSRAGKGLSYKVGNALTRNFQICFSILAKPNLRWTS